LRKFFLKVCCAISVWEFAASFVTASVCVWHSFTAGQESSGTTTVDHEPGVWILVLKTCPIKAMWLELLELGKLNACGNESGAGHSPNV